MLLLLVCGVLLAVQHSEATQVACYSTFSQETGSCSGLLGDGVDQDDCCLNPLYGFDRGDGKCRSCRPAAWSPWSPWSKCSVSCLEGVRQRRRRCDGVGECPDPEAQGTLQTAPCEEQACCPEAGGWAEWAPWQPCSVTCENGVKKRQRSCSSPPPACGGRCVGPDDETAACFTQVVCPVHGGWSAWGSWSGCSSNCHVEGSGSFPLRKRVRTCTQPPPSQDPPGHLCVGQAVDEQQCTSLPFCPVDGSWGAWSPPGPCSVTCGLGLTRMSRRCDSPAPRHQGRPCEGSDTIQSLCNTRTHCPVDGFWSEWDPWDNCTRFGRPSINCKITPGIQKRTRTCLWTDFGGQPCPGDFIETRNCFDVRNCFLRGAHSWSEWSTWGLCEPSCGAGSQKTRTRKCQPDYSSYPKEVGLKKEEVFFWGTPRIRCEKLGDQTVKVEQKEPCYNVPDCV
ncbi:properdin [Lepisosteus oculatus]|uniref:properdin n=1 Tax=Lepisosteus oculatus TaxID=7918 RepID=UPI0035F5178A